MSKGTWYGNVYSTGGNVYYYPQGSSNKNSRVKIDSWDHNQIESAYNDMMSNKADTENWNKDFQNVKKLYGGVQAAKLQQEFDGAMRSAYENMATAAMKEIPALEPLKQAADASGTAKSETNKRQMQRASLYSQYRRSGYAQGQKSTQLGG